MNAFNELKKINLIWVASTTNKTIEDIRKSIPSGTVVSDSAFKLLSYYRLKNKEDVEASAETSITTSSVIVNAVEVYELILHLLVAIMVMVMIVNVEAFAEISITDSSVIVNAVVANEPDSPSHSSYSSYRIVHS